MSESRVLTIDDFVAETVHFFWSNQICVRNGGPREGEVVAVTYFEAALHTVFDQYPVTTGVVDNPLWYRRYLQVDGHIPSGAGTYLDVLFRGRSSGYEYWANLVRSIVFVRILAVLDHDEQFGALRNESDRRYQNREALSAEATLADLRLAEAGEAMAEPDDQPRGCVGPGGEWQHPCRNRLVPTTGVTRIHP